MQQRLWITLNGRRAGAPGIVHHTTLYHYYKTRCGEQLPERPTCLLVSGVDGNGANVFYQRAALVSSVYRRSTRLVWRRSVQLHHLDCCLNVRIINHSELVEVYNVPIDTSRSHFCDGSLQPIFKTLNGSQAMVHRKLRPLNERLIGLGVRRRLGQDATNITKQGS